MYASYSTPSSKPELIACYVLVFSAISYGVCRFWNLNDVPAGVLLTPPFVALSFLLSRVSLRVEEAVQKEAWVTLAVVCLQGLFCLCFEATMVHSGISWLNGREHFAPDWAMWPASGALSLFNAGAVYGFAREIPKKAAVVNPGRMLAAHRWDASKKKAA